MTHITCRLTAKKRDQLRNPTLCTQVWATFTFKPQKPVSLISTDSVPKQVKKNTRETSEPDKSSSSGKWLTKVSFTLPWQNSTEPSSAQFCSGSVNGLQNGGHWLTEYALTFSAITNAFKWLQYMNKRKEYAFTGNNRLSQEVKHDRFEHTSAKQ